jgi:hypothetical protein
MQLVTNGVGEDYDLDFKGTLYGRSDSEKRDLAGDVAAMANTAGGLIVLGVAEDGHARAASAPGVLVNDAEAARIRQTVASGVHPLPLFDLLTVEDSAQPGHGFLLIAVPRSVMFPHAVLVNDALRYPRRNGATTRYLSEAEVAEAYRARFAGIAGRIDEAANIEAEFLTRLNTAAQAFAVVTLVPDLPGGFTIDTAAFQDFQRTILGHSPFVVPRGVSFQRATVRRRRLFADANLDTASISSRLAAEFHETGAGSVASYVEDIGATTTDTPTSIQDDAVVNAVAGALSLLARHARDRAAAGGYATVRVIIQPVSPDQPARLTTDRGFRDSNVGRQHVDQPPGADGVFDIDALIDEPPALLAATYQLCSGLFHEFGAPEALQLTASGAVRMAYWSHYWSQDLQTWAAANSVEITQEVLR